MNESLKVFPSLINPFVPGKSGYTKSMPWSKNVEDICIQTRSKKAESPFQVQHVLGTNMGLFINPILFNISLR